MRRRHETVAAELRRLAAAEGLALYGYSPGDAKRRYRIAPAGALPAGADWHDAAGVALASLVGPAEVRVWLAGYAAGRKP